MRFRLLLSILVVSLTLGCVQNQPPSNPVLSFKAGDASCASGEGKYNLSHSNGVVRLLGQVYTPTPCYTMEANLSSTGSNLILNLNAKPFGRMCIQCIGSIPVEAEISNLTKGQYNLTVYVDDNMVLSEKTDIS